MDAMTNVLKNMGILQFGSASLKSSIACLSQLLSHNRYFVFMLAYRHLVIPLMT